MSLNVNVNAKVLKGLEEMFQENTIWTIKMMAKKYGFSEEEALTYMNVAEEVKIVKSKVKEVKEPKEKKVKEKKEKKEGPKMVLPFCGRIVEEWCEGVKLNHGLYNQCTSEKSNEKYCKSCKKQAETNESGKPTLGDINERMLKSSAEYRAEKGKKCVVYSVVMKKLKITKEDAVAEALKFGLEIPEEEFEMPKSQRGRPKKLSESESVKSDADEGEKKRRGRPKKNKTVADNQTDETDDLIASLVAEANALKSGSASASETDASEAEESASEADASEADASEADAEEEEEEEEEENSLLLKEIVAKINADETYNKMNSMVVSKKDRKKHLNAMGEHIKTLLTEEELALYTGAPEEEEEEEEVEDEATRKAREAAEKKAQVEAEKKAKKEQADLEKKAKAELEKKAKAEAEAEKKAQVEAEKKAKAEAEAEKKAQLEAEKKAKAEADKKAKEEAAAEKKVQLEAEKKAKKEQADLEKKQKKEQADLEKKAQAKQKAEADKKAKEEAAALKKAGEKKPAEVTPVEKKTTAELQAETVEEPSTTETVNAKVFEFQGKKYLKTEDGILYDQETEECVGVWNEETKSIDDFADDEE
jgi:colicin import membrane protein